MDTNQKPSCTPKQLNKSFQNYDNVHRMNFLFELGKLTNKKYPLLSSFYSKNLKLISRKTQQRLDASIKHNLCKACNANLHSHPNVKIKLKKKHVYQTCPNCSNVKRFPCDNKQDRTEITKDDRVHEIFIGDASARQKKTEQSQCHEDKKSNKTLNTAVGIVKEASTIAATDKEANTVAATGKEANTVATTAEEDLKTRATSLKEDNSIASQTKTSSNTRTTTSSEVSSTLIVAINNEDTIAVATNKHQSNKVYANKEEGDDKMDTS
uniref:Uncharacterized protein n=1 Tax=Cacopsylla melanoneura TaxID=428564 RepID=A0A8D8SKJ3_9HEMI